MTGRRRQLVGATSVGAVSAAVLIALVAGPPGSARIWLSVIGLVAVGMSVSSVVAEPRELLATLVLGAAPVMGLAADDASAWLIGPLGALLLVGGELNAWSWELGGTVSEERDARRRSRSIASLALLGLLSSLAVSIAAQSTVPGGLVAVTLAAAALAALGWVILPGGRGSSEE